MNYCANIAWGDVGAPTSPARPPLRTARVLSALPWVDGQDRGLFAAAGSAKQAA